MIIKSIKPIALAFMAVFISVPIFAQAPFTGSNHFRKFSFGINGGTMRPSLVIGGNNDFTRPLYSFGYGANLKYQVNHYFALQGDILSGKIKGNNSKDYPTGRPATDRPNSSFITDMQIAASINGVITFGNINWLREKNKLVPYISAGGGLTAYKPKFIKTGTTTSLAFNNGKSVNEFFIPVGLGIKFLLSDLINLDLGYRAHFVDSDNFDGTTTGVYGNAHKDKFSYGFLGIEFALGKKSKKQLIFDNPAARLKNAMQTQVNQLQTKVDTLESMLSRVDSDGDGVPNQFDKEPNTPAGCAVDFLGVSKDSDGDGVPDCKDKQVITPTDCQPVDADGVGKCPDPECCKSHAAEGNTCTLGELPSISFKVNAHNLSNDAKALLAVISAKLKASAECAITVTGYPATAKASQSLCMKRIAVIKNYLIEKENISADRIITTCEPGTGDANVVDIKGRLVQ